MRINYNASAFVSASCLRKNETALSKSIQRLSSGLKINEAKDNPSGLAIAKRMNLQIRGVGNASENAEDGKQIIRTADGALNEVHDILQRMNELAVQAANGTSTEADKQSIQDEITQLQAEVERIANDTDFNGQSLLDGQFDLKGFTDHLDVKVTSYTDQVTAGLYKIELDSFDPTDPLFTPDNINTNIRVLSMDDKALNDTLYNKSYDPTTNIIKIEGPDGFGLELKVDDPTALTGDTVEVDVLGIGAMNIQVGANEGQILAMRIPTISLEAIGIHDLDMTTVEGAQHALDRMDQAIEYISSVRGRLGAYENRLEHTQSSLDCTEENMTSAYSRVMDLDMSEEMTEFTSMQVLTEAGTTMVAQANQRPQQILQLLQ